MALNDESFEINEIGIQTEPMELTYSSILNQLIRDSEFDKSIKSVKLSDIDYLVQQQILRVLMEGKYQQEAFYDMQRATEQLGDYQQRIIELEADKEELERK
ncbi:hypothetical protein PPERSA_09053 [Pseudocohnilembus persalinus]|uniref:Uncharacterized protein n=1 Tax=Pseudocohnilembus persalinus TaxID=266149 RepID=A0A0V0QKU6_PSEPJ|nr:hypothetical protein PPERSA_09053 [Pseudocohnilembus persalinus]|eukprot:KRX02931.1 hypothetical protein PPERSA_09053 [Pseudocohnilembus persalinus]